MESATATKDGHPKLSTKRTLSGAGLTVTRYGKKYFHHEAKLCRNVKKQTFTKQAEKFQKDILIKWGLKFRE